MENEIKESEILQDTDRLPWYAMRLYSIKQMEIAEYLQDKGLETFIPMEYFVYIDKHNRRCKKLRPVVRNLLFLKKTLPEKEIRTIVNAMPYQVSIIKKDKEHINYYEIPYKQMFEFKIMCNPDIEMRKYITEEEARLKTGDKVIVHHGPMKGMTGRLVRQSKKYYLLKEVPGMAVMIKVSRWCCAGYKDPREEKTEETNAMTSS